MAHRVLWLILACYWATGAVSACPGGPHISIGRTIYDDGSAYGDLSYKNFCREQTDPKARMSRAMFLSDVKSVDLFVVENHFPGFHTEDGNRLAEHVRQRIQDRGIICVFRKDQPSSQSTPCLLLSLGWGVDLVLQTRISGARIPGGQFMAPRWSLNTGHIQPADKAKAVDDLITVFLDDWTLANQQRPETNQP